MRTGAVVLSANAKQRLTLGLVTAALAAGFGLWGAEQASAENVSTSQPSRIYVGAPQGPCPQARVDGQRSGRTPQLAPAPRLLWQVQLRSASLQPPVVGPQDTLVLTTVGAELVQLGADGKEQWHRTTGISAASSGPVLLTDGTRLVLTSVGEALGFSPQGEPRFRAELSGFGTEPRVAPLALDNGSVVVAIGTWLLTIASDGTLGDRAELPERAVGQLLSTRQGLIATTESGQVYRWQSPLPPHLVGSFQGSVREGAALVDQQTLVAVADIQRLIAMDLRSGTTATWLQQAGLEGPPAVGRSGIAYVATSNGLVLAQSSSGEEQRVSLNVQLTRPDDPLGLDQDAGARTTTSWQPGAPLIVDQGGQIAFARADGRVGIISPQGRVLVAASIQCPAPVALVPLSQGRFVLTCREGAVYAFGP